MQAFRYNQRVDVGQWVRRVKGAGRLFTVGKLYEVLDVDGMFSCHDDIKVKDDNGDIGYWCLSNFGPVSVYIDDKGERYVL